MAKYKISAYIGGVKKTEVIDALDKNDAIEYAYCMWGVEDVWVEEVEE